MTQDTKAHCLLEWAEVLDDEGLPLPIDMVNEIDRLGMLLPPTQPEEDL